MSDTTAPVQGHLLSNDVYDKLKPVVQVLLPGAAALYFALAQIWGLPKAEEVVGTVAAVNVFLGLLLGLSSKQYNNSDARFDGAIDVVNRSGEPVLNFKMDSQAITSKDEVTLKVNTPEK